MENPLYTELFTLVRKIEETEGLIGMVEKPESKLFLTLPTSRVELGSETDQYLKTVLVGLLKKEQAEGWNRMLEIMNANSPFQ